MKKFTRKRTHQTNYYRRLFFKNSELRNFIVHYFLFYYHISSKYKIYKTYN